MLHRKDEAELGAVIVLIRRSSGKTTRTKEENDAQLAARCSELHNLYVSIHMRYHGCACTVTPSGIFVLVAIFMLVITISLAIIDILVGIPTLATLTLLIDTNNPTSDTVAWLEVLAKPPLCLEWDRWNVPDMYRSTCKCAT